MLGFLCSCKRFCALSVLFPFRSFARCFEKTNSSRDRPRSSVFGCFSIDWTSFRAPQAAPKSNWPWWLASKHDPTSPEVEARHAGEGGRGTEKRRVFRRVSQRRFVPLAADTPQDHVASCELPGTSAAGFCAAAWSQLSLASEHHVILCIYG